MIVNVTVQLEIDAKNEIEAEKILQEMDYNFSYVCMDEIGKFSLVEVDRITKYEIKDCEILN